jgi:hypothetical protein
MILRSELAVKKLNDSNWIRPKCSFDSISCQEMALVVQTAVPGARAPSSAISSGTSAESDLLVSVELTKMVRLQSTHVG